MIDLIQKIEEKFGYRFKDESLLLAALTHPSFRYENNQSQNDNQRLEFLGDAILSFLAADLLYREHSMMDEGMMTRLRSSLTSGKMLADIAEQKSLGDFLLLGHGEEQTGGRRRLSNLADALESFFAAVYLDGGLEAAKQLFESCIAEKLPEFIQSTSYTVQNPKGTLQELTQARWKKQPTYEVLTVEGPPHDREFTVQVRLDEIFTCTGKARNKQEAEAEAAAKAIRLLDTSNEASSL